MPHEYRVVINHEEQYSIWPEGVEGSREWRDVGFSGSLRACHRKVLEVWTDMRPLSLRRKLGKKNDGRAYAVVINHEEQYSIHLPKQKETDWRATGFHGSLGDCRDHIVEVWTDMRPLSLRR